ncbi:hypothetical protein ILYODFUR_018322 [Ilyodon furcidens]|uniref:Uncharacterized protein n=1 Tax=Ilyodon furcidens TaxID=33524 RepID=A0ABV0TWV1_9TELE
MCTEHLLTPCNAHTLKLPHTPFFLSVEALFGSLPHCKWSLKVQRNIGELSWNLFVIFIELPLACKALILCRTKEQRLHRAIAFLRFCCPRSAVTKHPNPVTPVEPTHMHTPTACVTGLIIRSLAARG